MGFLDFFRGGRVPQREEKASQFAPLIVSGRVGQAQWTERNPALYAKDGYQRNPVVFRCVRLIAQGAASMELDAYRGDAEIEQHPLLDLLKRPNPFQRGNAFLEAVYSYDAIAGNVFVEAVTVGQRVVELHVHRPDRVKVVVGASGYPAFYEFQANGMTRRVPVDEKTGLSTILHIKTFHPLSDWYGMSALDPASWAVDGHTAGAKEVKTTLDTGGQMQGAFFYDGDTALGDEQIGQAREMLADRLSESRKSRVPPVLNKFWKFEPIGAKPNELNVSALKADAAREICFAYGVPPMLLGIPGDNTYSNYAEANRAFWRETVIPTAQRVMSEIGSWLGDLTGDPTFRLVPDSDDVIALASERAERWTMLNQAEFITVNEKREACGFDPVDGGDKVLVASSDIPLEDAGANLMGGAEDPTDMQDAGDMPPQDDNGDTPAE